MSEKKEMLRFCPCCRKNFIEFANERVCTKCARKLRKHARNIVYTEFLHKETDIKSTEPVKDGKFFAQNDTLAYFGNNKGVIEIRNKKNYDVNKVYVCDKIEVTLDNLIKNYLMKQSDYAVITFRSYDNGTKMQVIELVEYNYNSYDYAKDDFFNTSKYKEEDHYIVEDQSKMIKHIMSKKPGDNVFITKVLAKF